MTAAGNVQIVSDRQNHWYSVSDFRRVSSTNENASCNCRQWTILEIQNHFISAEHVDITYQHNEVQVWLEHRQHIHNVTPERSEGVCNMRPKLPWQQMQLNLCIENTHLPPPFPSSPPASFGAVQTPFAADLNH